MTRPFAPVAERVERRHRAADRRARVSRRRPADDRSTGVPDEWRAQGLTRVRRRRAAAARRHRRAGSRSKASTTRARNDCSRAAERAGAAFEDFRHWVARDGDAARLRIDTRAEPSCSICCSPRGHWCDRPRAIGGRRGAAALDEALEQLRRARPSDRARRMARGPAAPGDAHPAPDDYLRPITRIWDACRERARECDLVTWPD